MEYINYFKSGFSDLIVQKSNVNAFYFSWNMKIVLYIDKFYFLINFFSQPFDQWLGIDFFHSEYDK